MCSAVGQVVDEEAFRMGGSDTPLTWYPVVLPDLTAQQRLDDTDCW
jgi:hypothetical protein